MGFSQFLEIDSILQQQKRNDLADLSLAVRYGVNAENDDFKEFYDGDLTPEEPIELEQAQPHRETEVDDWDDLDV